ncbi:MAG: type II toxin-antitoxin system RelE/ParE family toxin [Nitrospirae bacterium]|nr:type II toxin-antitoxin system RelE/ParE family toxin [Nitrospirota bacterium]
MGIKIEFIPAAEEDYETLDGALKKEAAKKIDALANNPFLGKPLGNKLGIDLTGFYKLYFDKKRYRIVYRPVGDTVEIIEIFAIGKRDKEKIYKLVGHRLKKLRKP